MLRAALVVSSSLLFATPAFASPPSPAAASETLAVKIPATKLKLFALVYRSDSGTVAEVRLNDVPVVNVRGEGTSGSSNEIQGWLKPGTNRIDVRLDKVGGDEPLRVSLHGLAEPGFPDDSNELARVVIKKGTAAGARGYTFELPANQAPPSAVWTKAEVITSLTDADRKELHALATSLLAAIKKGDIPALEKLYAFSLAERARFLYADPAQFAGMVKEMGPELKKTFGKVALPAKLEFTLVAGGRVVRLTVPGKRALFVVSDGKGEESAAMPVSCAKIDGHFTLIP